MSLMEMASQIAAAGIEIETVEYGGDPLTSPNPWLGTMRSRTADLVPRNYAVGGSDFLYLPRSHSFKRRGGQTQKFDTFGGGAVGLLPAKWSGRARWIEEFLDTAACADGIPTVAALVTRETVASGLDDGRFSQFWLRDQVNGLNYAWGSEYDSSSYPAPGAVQGYRVTPLWYDSGDGGITRGTSEFARRFFFGGSRRFLKVGSQHYFPSLLGTPSRAQRRLVGRSSPSGFLASSDLTSFGTQWGTSGAATQWEAIQTKDDTTSFAHRHGDVGTYNFDLGLAGALSTTINVWTITYRARREGTAPIAGTTYAIGVTRSDNLRAVSANIDATLLTTSWADYTTTVVFGGTTSGAGANSLRLNAVVPLFFDGYIEITYVRVSPGVGDPNFLLANHLIPSGPLPPLYAGTLAKGNPISTPVGTLRPDADVTVGGWVTAPLFSKVDDADAGLSDYISCPAGSAACTLGLSDPSVTPTTNDTVTVNLTDGFGTAAAGIANTMSIRLLEGATARKTMVIGPRGGTINWIAHSFTLSAVELASIIDWTTLRLEFTVTGAGALSTRVARADLTITSGAVQTQGGWKGSDRFYYSLAFRFEDGSVWATCPPRPPNDLLEDGFGLFTVDYANPDVTYDSVAWSNLAIGPRGTIGRILLRSTKISAVKDDNLQLDPFDLRIIWEIKDNTTTTYTDYYGSDDSLALDQAEAFIRYDHSMPPRARYIFGGDMRVCHSYGGQNPCAIEIAPVGRAADYDLNLADDAAAAYNAQASFMQIGIDTSGAGTLTLIQGDGATATDTLALAFTTHTTLQKLVDKINSTSFAVEGQQWRAQMCPGANPDATTLSLTPHNRAIASCVISGQTITKSAGGLAKVAVGHRIDGSGVTAGAYVSRIDSDTQLTFVGTIAGATVTLYFYNDLGDSQITTPANATQGYQRVIAGSLPGFLYFNNTYLAGDPIHKDTVWMTVASPGQAKSAANNFSGRQSNRFSPPHAAAGISMGGAACDNGFVTPYANAIYAIKNVFQQGSGLDQDYRQQVLNESRGCCAWNTVVPGNRFVPYLTPHGLFAADLDREILLSEAIFLHAPATGDFDYETPKCVAATAADVDYLVSDSSVTAYASARVMRTAIWLNYRDSGSTGRPDRQVVYDFSSGTEQNGLAALLRDDGRTPWGWSNELTRALTAMGVGRRTDGEHLYGWNDANAGSTGDGRIDEFETGDTDNGTAIAGSILTPWEKGNEQRQVSGQDIVVEHSSPAGSTGSLTFYRSYSEDAYAMTPSTSSTLVVSRDVKMLPQAARAQSAACKVGFSQATGGAREVRKISLRLKYIRAYR